VDAGELSPLTLNEYKEVCELVVAHVGKGRLAADVGPDDFSTLRAKMATKRANFLVEPWHPVR
jgi:hypothetical protein